MRKMTISNFKAYAKPTTLEFSDITIQAGMNSVGKSTAVQAILLARQAAEARLGFRPTHHAEESHSHWISLNGPFDLHLGDYNQVMMVTHDREAEGNDGNQMSIRIDDAAYIFKAEEERPLSLLYQAECGDAYGVDPSQAFYYINAERMGPRNYQAIAETTDNLCGYHGENTFDVISRSSDIPVLEERRNEDAHNLTVFSSQLETWMRYIIPGVHFQTSRNMKNQIVDLSIRQENLDTDFGSPHNFGFGISYLLPIVVTGLLAEERSIFIVENPEAHLHPSGQSRIGRFLAQVAFSGVQVIVETHSEHVINGVRLYALKHQISPERICINNFSIKDGRPDVVRIPLNSKMDILQWPEGFFDQEEKDLEELRHMRRDIK